MKWKLMQIVVLLGGCLLSAKFCSENPCFAVSQQARNWLEILKSRRDFGFVLGLQTTFSLITSAVASSCGFLKSLVALYFGGCDFASTVVGAIRLVGALSLTCAKCDHFQECLLIDTSSYTEKLRADANSSRIKRDLNCDIQFSEWPEIATFNDWNTLT